MKKRSLQVEETGGTITASDWHFKLFRSWKFIVLILCVLLTAPAEYLSLQIGNLVVESAEYVEAPLHLTQQRAEAARERAAAMQSGTEESRAAYAEYVGLSNTARKLWFSMHAMSIYGWTARVAAVSSMLVAVADVFFLLGKRMAGFAMQPIHILLKIKLFAMYAQGIGFICGFAGFSDVFDIVRSAGGQAGWDVLAMLAYLMPFVLIVYVIMLRNLSMIADDVAKVMRSDKYPGAFGQVCGLSWQCWALTGICLVAFLAILADMIYAASTGYGDVLADLLQMLTDKSIMATLALVYLPIWTLMSAVKYAFMALLYPEYIRFSQEMKGCAADIVKDNTPEYATPVYYRRK